MTTSNRSDGDQLALPFEDPECFTAADFIEAPSNRAARAALAAPATWVNGRLVLWGESGCGKSHLARVWADERGAHVVLGAQLCKSGEAVRQPLLIEDYDILREPLALLALLERAAAAKQPTLLTGRVPPARLALHPADLASRLRASLTIRIEAPEAGLLEAMLIKHAAARQLLLPSGLSSFLLDRLPRRPAVLREAIARLDRYSLSLGTAPSRRIAERVIEELAEPRESSTSEHNGTVVRANPPVEPLILL